VDAGLAPAAGIGGFGGGLAAPAPVAIDASTAKANARTEEMLRKVMPEVKLENTAISDVLDYFRDATGANMFVDWRSLEAAGIDRNAPVTLRLHEVPASDILRLALKCVSPSIVYEIENGIVIVHDPNNEGVGPAPQVAVTRAYDVSDLLEPAGLASGSNKMAQLIELVTATVAAGTWAEQGGSSTIKGFNAKVVVCAPDTTQQEVARVLEMLREKPAADLKPKQGS